MRAVLLLLVALAQPASTAPQQVPAAEDVTIPPKLLTRVLPGYFAAGFRDLFKGSPRAFSIDIGVNAGGRVMDEQIVQPSGVSKEIEADTIAALRKWTFEPARRGGVAVPSAVRVTVRFVEQPSPGRGGPGPMRLVPRLSMQGADDDFGKGVAVEGGPGITPPRNTGRVDPKYPPGAMARRAQGAVLLDAVILADGTVGAVRVAVPVDAELDAEAMRVVRLWKYSPAVKNGQPVAILMQVTVVFSMR